MNDFGPTIEDDDEEDWEMTLNRYQAEDWAVLSWPFGPRTSG